MNIGIIGLGALGLPVACAWASKGHTVYGYDNDRNKLGQYRAGKSKLYEPSMDEMLQEQLKANRLIICNKLVDVVSPVGIIFIAVPTPSRDDDGFDFTIVQQTLRDIGAILSKNKLGYKLISVISTVLPMTCRKEFLPILEECLGKPSPETYGFCYNAQFIAMGTVVDDELNPEFVLCGEVDAKSGEILESFYDTITEAPILRMTIENAEIAKCCYNTQIGTKILLANAVMEMCDKIPNANCDVVTDALGRANKRIVSTRYMKGGVGDGGKCHGRDNRALSFLANGLNLSVDPFKFTNEARNAQTEYLASVVYDEYVRSDKLPVVMLGKTFKPLTDVTEDSCAILLDEDIEKLGIPVVGYDDPGLGLNYKPTTPHIFVIATAWPQFSEYPYPKGSVVVDPWRMLAHNPPEGCTYRPIGIGPKE